MERVKGHRYLFRRAGILYFRRAVPANARQAFGGHTEIWVSLETGDVAKARHAMVKHLADFDSCLSASRGVASPVPVLKEPVRAPERIEIEEAVRQVLGERLAREHTEYFKPKDRDAARELISSLASAEAALAGGLNPAANVDFPLSTEWMADALIERFGWDLSPKDADYWFLLRFVAQSQLEGTQQIRAEISGAPREVRNNRFGPEQYQQDIERRQAREGGNAVWPSANLRDNQVYREFVAQRQSNRRLTIASDNQRWHHHHAATINSHPD